MSLLSSFIAGHLVNALEAAFVAHEPEMQEALLDEIKEFSDEVVKWLDAKFADKVE